MNFNSLITQFLKPILKYFFVLLIVLPKTIFSQSVTVSGIITSDDNTPLEAVTIAIKEIPSFNTLSNEKGFYSVQLEKNKIYTLVFFSINHSNISQTISTSEDKIYLSPVLKFKNELKEVEIHDFKSRSEETVRLDSKIFSQIPSTTGNLEDIIKTQMGVSSNNELSSGYSVRGGNFDENLVYVNDIEVYRPFLVRSGQQEGLSFANPNMVQNINFSAGGFESRYGDKLSSVLDITYRKPLKFAGTASGSFMGGNAQVEGISKNRLVAWNIGTRYRTNNSLLNTLDTKGEYRPSAFDFQSFITFDFNPKLKLEYLVNFANNKYLVIPKNRQTDFGTVNNVLRLSIYFDGQELMQYNTIMNGLSLTYKPTSKVKLKFITSGYRANEQELYTVQGQYYIDQLEADLGKPNFGQVAYNRGVGTFINNGRNYLTANVVNAEHKGWFYINKSNEILWGVRQQYEKIEDRLGEWKTVDSAGYIVPYSPVSIDLIDVYKTKLSLESWRTLGYMQYNFSGMLRDSSMLKITAGVRANSWTANGQTVVSPRISIGFKPNWKKDWLFKLSGGYYYQPPFYRELRTPSGQLNKGVKAQQSVHCVLSADYIFYMWHRPFKLITAAYFKDLRNVIPYEVDNVRIRYFANNNTLGYATGIDMRINGEFVKGVESWASIGILRTYEYSKDNLHYVYYNKDKEEIIRGYTFDQVKADSTKVDPGYIPRPTDQLVTFGMFFQDFFPKYPAFKFNLNMQFGSGLPFGPPTHLRWQQTRRMPPYRRVDVGFAYNVLKANRAFTGKNVFNKLNEMWLYFEVFNLLQIQNTVSYTWVKDVTGNTYAVPNYLTNRQLNLRMVVKF